MPEEQDRPSLPEAAAPPGTADAAVSARPVADSAETVAAPPAGAAVPDAARPASEAATEPEEPAHEPMPRDPDVAQRALAQVQRLLHRQHIVQQITERQHFAEDDARHELVSRLTHKQHEAELRAVIDDLHPADIAYVLEALPPDDRAEVWGLVAPEADAETLGEVLLEASEAVCESLVEALSHERLVQIAAALDADQLADLAPLLPQAVIDEVTQSLTTEEREDFRAALSFEEGSVGARMVFEMVTIRDDVTLETVLRYLRLFDELPDHTDQVFVIDRDDHLKGALSLNTLLVNDPDATVADLMQTEIFTLHAEDDASDAAQAFERYDFVSAPVIDRRGRLIGRLTVAEIVDVIREETEEQVLSAAGLREEEDMFSSVWESAKNRWLWLGINMGTAFFASRVIGAFEGTIERIVALAALMPIVAGIAGNSGNQTMTLLIRSIALGQITPANVRRLMLKELAVALANGVVWGTVAATFAVLLYFSAPYVLKLGTVMFMAMVLNMLVGAAVGMAVPMLLKKLGRDPAMGSSVLLTFTTDSGGFFIFLGLATLFFS